MMVLDTVKQENRPYRFEAMWQLHPECERIIKGTWDTRVHGSRAFSFMMKIKLAKEALN